ncbi:uncharacterized protein [Elaeis guineensis]|uniref:Uncharacterized protein LOC109505492 n=1 Tax=Elaeis guineensis var. tenera TaxID=51953 RepID=A0A6J0PEV1_ELAGV|nr:uncharacterized protein LOC109505492 [Elaeis guineensis]
MCCFPSKSCCLCFLLLLVILLIGFVFGFGVFAHGFHKLRDAFHLEGVDADGMRPFLGQGAPAPF